MHVSVLQTGHTGGRESKGSGRSDPGSFFLGNGADILGLVWIQREGRRGEGFGEELERTRNVHWRKTEPTVNYVTVCMYDDDLWYLNRR